MSDFNQDELVSDFKDLSHDELLEMLANCLYWQRETAVSNRHKTKQIKAENAEMRKALIHGTSAVEKATSDVIRYKELIEDATHTILMWRRTSYVLCLLIVALGFVLIGNQ